MIAQPASLHGSTTSGLRLPRGAPLPLGLLLVAAAVNAFPLAPGQAFYSRDLYAFWHPVVDVFVRSIGEGAWPVWNPYFGFGEPLAANPAVQLAYPPTWLNLILPAALYFKLFVLAHTVAGAIGMAALARRLRSGRLGAFAAGATWAACGPLLSCTGMYHHFAAAAWMPWVLHALDRVLRRPGPRRALILGAAAAGQALAGSADLCFMTALLGAGWIVASIARGTAQTSSPLRTGALLALAGAFAAALAAVQWGPALALVPGTARGVPSAAGSLYWSLHPLSLLDLWLPRLTTGAAATTAMGASARARLFESREPLLVSTYLGLPAAVLAAGALVSRLHRRSALVLASGFVVLVLAALGRHTPLLPALMRLPGVAVFRFPPKYLLPAAALWSLLVGLGVDALVRARGRARVPRVLGAVALAMAVALLAMTMSGGLPSTLAAALADPQPAAGLLAHVKGTLGRSALALALAGVGLCAAAAAHAGRRRAALALALLVAADLVHAGLTVNPAVPVALTRYRPPFVDRLRAGGADARVYSVKHTKDWMNEQFVRYPPGWTPAGGWILGALDRLPAAVGARWGLLGSYDGDLTGLAPPMMGRLSARVSELSDSAAGLRLLQLGGVDYVVSLDPAVFGGGLERFAEEPSVFRDPVLLLRAPDPLPKAFVAERALAIPDDEQALRVLADPRFDARNTVIVPALATAANASAAGAAADEVATLWRRCDAVRFRVAARAPGYLVALEAFDPGWTARVDGAPAPLLRANLLFRAVPLPAGVHDVEMRYRPRALPGSAFVSALAAAAGLVLFRSRRLR